METALDRAKAAVGGNVGLAQKLGGISPQAISQWPRVPANRVLAVEAATNIPRHELRPDIYPPEPDRASAPTEPAQPEPVQ